MYNLATNAFDPPVVEKPWEKIDEAHRYLKFVAEGAIPASAITDLPEDEVQQFAKSLSLVFKFLKDDHITTLHIRRALNHQDHSCTQLENNLAKLALMLVGPKEVSE